MDDDRLKDQDEVLSPRVMVERLDRCLAENKVEVEKRRRGVHAMRLEFIVPLPAAVDVDALAATCSAYKFHHSSCKQHNSPAGHLESEIFRLLRQRNTLLAFRNEFRCLALSEDDAMAGRLPLFKFAEWVIIQYVALESVAKGREHSYYRKLNVPAWAGEFLVQWQSSDAPALERRAAALKKHRLINFPDVRGYRVRAEMVVVGILLRHRIAPDKKPAISA